MINDSGTAAHAQIKKHKRRFHQIMLILGIASVFVFELSITIGRAGIINPLKLMQAVLKKTEDYNQMLRILQNIRIPRALASFMVGACLLSNNF